LVYQNPTSVFSNEEEIKFAILTLPFSIHEAATQGRGTRPLPGDAHSDIVLFNSNLSLEGRPDFLFYDLARARVTAVVDVKTPWLVTPQKINEVLNSKYPNYLY
jgi:hypothetical protein